MIEVGIQAQIPYYMRVCATCIADIGEEMAALKTYVVGHKLLDPSLDTRQLVTEFVNGFYGSAAASVVRYVNMMDQACRQLGGYRPGVPRARANALEGNFEWGIVILPVRVPGIYMVYLSYREHVYEPRSLGRGIQQLDHGGSGGGAGRGAEGVAWCAA